MKKISIVSTSLRKTAIPGSIRGSAASRARPLMYVGWPKGWAVFRLAKEVWNEIETA